MGTHSVRYNIIQNDALMVSSQSDLECLLVVFLSYNTNCLIIQNMINHRASTRLFLVTEVVWAEH